MLLRHYYAFLSPAYLPKLPYLKRAVMLNIELMICGNMITFGVIIEMVIFYLNN